MKHLSIFLLSVVTISCKQANVTEIKPIANTLADSSKVLLVEDKYPCMKLVTDKAIHLPVSTKGNDSSLEDRALRTSIRYLALETKEECLIGDIDKLESDDSFIFIFDKENDQVFRFSQKDGSFLNKFGQKGRGPGEYTHVTNMTLNRTKKEVCLLDIYGYKLLYFNYDGTLIREEPLFYCYNAFEFVKDRMLLCTNFNDNDNTPAINNNRLVLAEANQTPLYVGFSFPESFDTQFHQNSKMPFITCGEDVYYNHVLSDTIWQIKENGVCEAKYIFKFPGRDNLFNEKDFQKITDDEYEERQQDIPYYRDELIITKDFVKAFINNAQSLLYCTSTGHVKYSATYQSFGKPTNIRDTKFALNEKSFVSVLQPFEVIQDLQFNQKFLGESKYAYFLENQISEEERNLITTMTEEDNPILLIMDIEPF